MVGTIKKALYSALMASLLIFSGCATLGGTKAEDESYVWKGKSVAELQEWVCSTNSDPEMCMSKELPNIAFMPKAKVFAKWMEYIESKGYPAKWRELQPQEAIDNYLNSVKERIVGFWAQDDSTFYVSNEESICEIESQICYAIVIYTIEQIDGKLEGKDQFEKYQIQSRMRVASQIKSKYFIDFCQEEENASPAPKAK